MRSGWEGQGRVRLDLQGKVSSYTIDRNRHMNVVMKSGHMSGCNLQLNFVADLCGKKLFRAVWQYFVLKLNGRTVLQNCVAKLCSGTVWRILLSESVWCPWQPASQQPPPQQDAISAFPVSSFFLLFPLFVCGVYTKFSQESSYGPLCLI